MGERACFRSRMENPQLVPVQRHDARFLVVPAEIGAAAPCVTYCAASCCAPSSAM
jgi:hypothetical protein